MPTIQRIEKSVPIEDITGKPRPGMFRTILIWAVLSDNMRDTLYEARGAMPVHQKECESWLKMFAQQQQACPTCGE